MRAQSGPVNHTGSLIQCTYPNLGILLCVGVHPDTNSLNADFMTNTTTGICRLPAVVRQKAIYRDDF